MRTDYVFKNYVHGMDLKGRKVKLGETIDGKLIFFTHGANDEWVETKKTDAKFDSEYRKTYDFLIASLEQMKKAQCSSKTN